jgi:hypothetical protein
LDAHHAPFSDECGAAVNRRGTMPLSLRTSRCVELRRTEGRAIVAPSTPCIPESAMAHPAIAQKKPFEAGEAKTLRRCTCGIRVGMPMCDETHNGP